MPFVKGSKHSPESRAKISAAHKGKPHSAERKAKIGAAHRGKKVPAKYERVCPCGVSFASGASNAKFCSRKCAKAARGHGLRHAPAFLHFKDECGICGSKDELVGDHDHATGAARGILCRCCNLAIGNMRDDSARLRAAADYLDRHALDVRRAFYLSGPMSGLPDSNYPAFHRAARELRAKGLRIESPAENSAPACGTWSGWMRLAIRQLVRCEAVVVLPGWERSRGAKVEVGLARDLDMPVYLLAEALTFEIA